MLSDEIVQAITNLWKNANHKIRYDNPVLPIVLDAQGDPQLLTTEMLGGGGDASAENQVIANTHLENLEGLIAQLVPTANPIYILSGTATVLPSYHAIKGFQAVGTATGAFTVDIPIECSNDNTNWTEAFYFQLGDTPNRDSDVRVWESNLKYWRIGTARNETGTGVAYSVTVAV